MEALQSQVEQVAAEVEEGEILMDQDLAGELSEILEKGGEGRVLGEEEYASSVVSFLDPPDLVKENSGVDGQGEVPEEVALPDGDSGLLEEDNSTPQQPKLPTNSRKVIFSQKTKKSKKPSKARKASKANSSRGKLMASEDKN